MAIKPHRVLEISYIGDTIRQVGDIVDYEEKDAGPNLELVKKGRASAAVEAEEQTEPEQV